MASRPRKQTTDALEILDRRYFGGLPEMECELEAARERLRVADQIYEMRRSSGLTQAELARLAKTSRTVITRLEDPGYQGHTLTSLRKVAAAMGHELRVEFVPRRDEARRPSRKVMVKGKG